MTCERCYGDASIGEHGLYKCPLQTRTSTAVWADAIPGGIEIAHGLCNDDGTPRRFDSHSEMRAFAKAKGVVPYHDVHREEGNETIKAGREHSDWLRSSEAQRARRDREEQRHEKFKARDRAAAQR